MTKIVADRRQIHPRFQKRYRRAVAHAVWMEPLVAEIGDFPASTVYTLSEDVADTEPSQGLATVIQKSASFRSYVQIPFLAESSQDRGGLRPQRTVALFPPLAKQPHLKRFGQLEVAGTQIDDLLYAGSSIKHDGKKRVVAGSL